jgi:HIV Tat-specific factor 1
MNGRYFGGREIEAMIYDGKLMLHKASKEDDLEDEEKRIERFSQWLEEDRDDE